MPKKSAIIIVCNGEPFVKPQLDNIYHSVDEIIIVEGADRWFQKVIKSERSTDGTIQTIKNYLDPENKIKLFHVNSSKNQMVKKANMECTGEFIYHVDIDEFMRPEHIEHAFQLLEDQPTVQVPQRWYYKWPDVHLASARPNYIRALPTRFYRNRIDEGLILSHIPCNGYYRGNKHEKADAAQLPMAEYAYHYFAIYRFQLDRKMRYYCLRDKHDISLVGKRLKEYDSFKREDVVHNLRNDITFRTQLTLAGRSHVKSYNGILTLETHPFLKEFK
jgi:hypothetical protein